MKKEDVISFLVYIAMIVLAIVVGFVVLGPTFSQYGRYFPGGGQYNILFALLFVVAAILFNVVMIEVSHIVGAKVSGYNVISVNVLGFCFYKSVDKWKFAFRNFDGLTGETRIAPNKATATPKAYCLFPLVFYVIEVAACMALYYVFTNIAKADQSTNGHFMLIAILGIIFITVGGMLELYNIFPARLDSTTDGYRLVIMSKKENIEAYNELMRIENAAVEGKVLDDMKTFDDITDFTAEVNLHTVYLELSLGNFEKAETLIDKTLSAKDKIHKGVYFSALAQKLFLIINSEKDIDDIKAFYDSEVNQDARRAIANDLTMESIRAYLLISGILDESEAECRYAISRKAKALKRTPVGRQKIEGELFDKALDLIDKKHPDWKIKEEIIEQGE